MRLEATGFGPDTDGPVEPAPLAGRGEMFVLDVDGASVVMRRYHRGGMMRYVGAGFRSPLRPFRELALSERLRAAGVRTPQVVFARSRPRDGGRGWICELGTVRIDSAIDLGVWLEAVRAGDVPDRERRGVLRAAGELVAELHRVGFLHADLQPQNLLLEERTRGSEAARLWVIDLDRSRFVESPSEGSVIRNLARLWRAVRKREARGAPFVRRTDCARFLRAHAAHVGSSWKRRWRRIERIQARGALLHGLGRALERRAGLAPEQPGRADDGSRR